MSKGISIKIDGKWAAVNEDAEISIEMSSPVLNEEGTFSLPFELPYAENRHLFGNLGDPDGTANLYDLDGKDFELYFDDILLYFGIVETDDEEEITDTIPLNFVSGNAMLKTLVEGMKASDVEVKDKIKLGYTVGQCSYEYAVPSGGFMTESFALDTDIFMNYENYNVSFAYPTSSFCNVRICYQPDGWSDYKILDARRPWSGVCFYVAYFLDCLWNKLGVKVNYNALLNYEDLKRLAFFTTKCDANLEHTSREITDLNSIINFVPSFKLNEIKIRNLKFSNIQDVYATGKNFPDEDVSTIIDSLKNAFGVKFYVDNSDKGINIILLKDIFTDDEVLSLNCQIVSEVAKHYKRRGYIVKYSATDDENTAFNYNNWNNPVEFSNYKDIISVLDSYDMSLYVNTVSGKLFRVKVNKDATNKDEWYPSLFEVGQFNQVKFGDAPDEECEELEIGFIPITMNDVNFKDEVKGIQEQILAAFIDTSMLPPTSVIKTRWDYFPDISGGILGGYSLKRKFATWTKEENYDTGKNDKSPLRSLDSGFTLGIMRGPGNNAGIDYYNKDYDGNGNDAWVMVPTSYSFDEDYITNWNQVYDYNGSEAGVPYIDEMFSLKLRAQKHNFPIDSKYAYRGLVDKFLTEYAYFLSNHKTVIITARMELTQVLNLKWEKKHRIGQRIGYINHISYTLSNSGISDVTIELFTI